MITLTVEKRTSATPQALRRAGRLPAVVYGKNHSATSVTLDARAFQKAFREAGEATIVSLEGLDETLSTLIHEVAVDPLTSEPMHVDFYAVTKGQMVEVAIPLVFTGVSPAVEAGANLVKVMHELEVEADPTNLPQSIEVDLSLLKVVSDRICARDLALPAGVSLAIEPDEVIALTQEVAAERVEEPVAADISTIEVEKKGKEEEPEAEAK